MRIFPIFAATVLALSMNSCSKSETEPNSNRKTTSIVATVDDGNANPAESRTAIYGGTSSSPSYFGIVWNTGDRIGVFSAGSNNALFTYEGADRAKRATFTGSASGTPLYAYYPYSADAGTDHSALQLTVPAEQSTLGTNCDLSGDFKIGRPKEDGSNEFTFRQVLSMARIQVNASGTDLAGQKLRRVTMTVSGNDIVGSFTLDATKFDDAKNAASNFSNTGNGKTVSAVFTDEPSLASPGYAFVSFFPTIKNGDNITFEIETSKKIATVKVQAAADFQAGYVYSLPLSATFINDPAKTTIVDNPNGDIEWIDVEGTFTCASANVDGLPQKILGITINGDGPGADGTKKISNAIAIADWDFFGVSEDFEYNDELCSALSAYDHGTYRGSVSLAQVASTADTDGLNFFWKKGMSVSGEKMIEYTDKKGDLTHGADEKIKKGFRHYEVAVAEGVIIDVYITHMNTYSGSGNTESNAYIKAVLSQLRQLRDYVFDNMVRNKRPAIVMGDTNMRYTRHNIKANLIDVLREGITFNDPWVDFYRGGIFPSWDSKSLMIQSKYGGNTDDDILCCDDQRGEVVDKIWYFNIEGADIKISVDEFKNDTSDNFTKSIVNTTFKAPFKDGLTKYTNQFVTIENADGSTSTQESVTIEQRKGLADHFPVVAKFRYTGKVAK